MLVPLLMTTLTLVAAPAMNPAAVVGPRQQIVGEFNPHDLIALGAFEQSVEDYVALHRRLARLTPPLQVTSDPVQLRQAIDTLAEAIRLARQTAQTGDIFTPVVADMFRRRIDRGLWDLDVAALMVDMAEDDEPGATRPVVNGRFPWNSGNAMWPSVLVLLPDLPEELEYRFVGGDLVLIDVRAGLVVDVLEHALTSDS
jgi:hypothetical protein